MTTRAKTIAAIAEGFGLTGTTLRASIKQAQSDESNGTKEAPTTTERSELIELRKTAEACRDGARYLKNPIRSGDWQVVPSYLLGGSVTLPVLPIDGTRTRVT